MPIWAYLTKKFTSVSLEVSFEVTETNPVQGSGSFNLLVTDIKKEDNGTFICQVIFDKDAMIFL